MSNKREQGLRERKRRILAAARDIIVRKGADGLTTRGLAEAAGMTVPTLYNLIGDKSAILAATAADCVDQVWERLEFDRPASPIEMANAIIEEAYAVSKKEEAFYKALIPLLEQLGMSFAASPDRDDAGARAARHSVQMAVAACTEARRRGLLRGEMPSEEIGEQMFIAFRGPLRDWIEGVIDDAEMLRRQRRGFLMAMAADATDVFRDEIMEHLAPLFKNENREEAA